MIVWHDVKQGSEEWFRRRRGLWTGSKVLRLLQGKPYKEDVEWEGNDATRRGHALEVAAIREYERKYRTKVRRPGGVTNTVYPNAWYSPDGIDRAWLLEAKAFVGKSYEKLISDKGHLLSIDDIISSRIPLTVKVQLFFGMIITGKRKARILAMNPDIPDQEQLVIIEVYYDKLIGNNIRKKLREDIKKRRSTS